MRTITVGDWYEIKITDEANDELKKLESKHGKNLKSCLAQFYKHAERLASHGKPGLKMPEHFRHEWNGIWAIKTRCGLRGYGIFYNDEKEFIIFKVTKKARDKISKKLRSEINESHARLQEMLP